MTFLSGLHYELKLLSGWKLNVYRKDALIRKAQPEALDDPLKVTAPHQRVFTGTLLVLLLTILVVAVLAA